MRHQANPGLGAKIIASLERRMSKTRRISMRANVISTMDSIIKCFAREERLKRETTLCFEWGKGFQSHEQVEAAIKELWMDQSVSSGFANHAQGTVVYRRLNKTFCEFQTIEDKNMFLDLLSTQAMSSDSSGSSKDGSSAHASQEYATSARKLKDCVMKEFKKAHVRLEMINIEPGVDPSSIRNQILKSCPPEAYVSSVRESKLMTSRNVKSLLLQVDATAFRHIMETLSGKLIYRSPRDGSQVKRVQVRVNGRPFICPNCYSLGNHHQQHKACPGRLCSKCGETGHSFKECKGHDEYCVNCKQLDHTARDLDCPSYLKMYARELRKMDIPMEYYEDDTARARLLSILVVR